MGARLLRNPHLLPLASKLRLFHPCFSLGHFSWWDVFFLWNCIRGIAPVLSQFEVVRCAKICIGPGIRVGMILVMLAGERG